MRHLLPILLLAACTPETETRWSVVSFIELGRAVDEGGDVEVSSGFDLDGIVSEEDGSDGCGIGDYVNPDGTPGVDNALARVIPALMATEASAVEPLINQNINIGELVLIFGVSGIDDPVDDEQVDVTFVRGFGSPIVGADGRLVSGQTFDRDTELEPVTVDTGVLEDGVLRASGLDVAFPIEIFSLTAQLDIENVSIHLDYDDRGDFTGYLGGALNYDPLLEGLAEADIDQSLQDTLPLIFENNADLPSPDGDECSRMSATIEFDGLSAYLHEPPEGLE